MPDRNQVTTLVVAGSILVLAVALVGGGLVLAFSGGRPVVGAVSALLGVAVAVAGLLFTLSPLVAQEYDPEGEDGGS